MSVSKALKGALDQLREKPPEIEDIITAFFRSLEKNHRLLYREEQTSAVAPFIDLGGES